MVRINEIFNNYIIKCIILTDIDRSGNLTMVYINVNIYKYEI